MSTNTVYLVTGANRGIGAGIVSALLQRPNTTVIATSRKPVNSTEPPAPQASGSKFISFLLDEENPEITSATLAARLEKEQGITKLNVVIANAGDSAGFSDVLGTNPDDMLYDFRVNSVGPAKLFRACWPLLDHDSGDVGQKKFVVISSSMGSIGLQFTENLTGLAYGMSKAALNYFAVSTAVQFREKGLLVGVVHPGWVKTQMGQDFANAAGYAGEIPTDVPTSAKGIIERIDSLTPETSGRFFNYDGKPVQW